MSAASLLVLATASILCAEAAPLGTPGLPELPLWYRATYKYSSPTEGVELLADALNGDRGVSQNLAASSSAADPSTAASATSSPFVYHTLRLNVHFPQDWTLTVQSILYKGTGEEANYTWWNHAGTDSGGGDGSGGATGCSVSLAPVGDALAGIDMDWINEAPDLTFLGNVTVTTDFHFNITAAHWASPSTCRDVFLVRVPPPPSQPWMNPSDVPVLYTVADTPASPFPAGCTLRQRSYSYSSFEPLSFYEAGQGSPEWRLPDRCAPNATIPGGTVDGLAALQDGYVRTVWLAVGCVLSGFVGVVGTFLFRYGFRGGMGVAGGWVKGSADGSFSLGLGGGHGSMSARLMDVI